MKQMKDNLKRLLSIILVFAMIFSATPVAFAEENTPVDQGTEIEDEDNSLAEVDDEASEPSEASSSKDNDEAIATEKSTVKEEEKEEKAKEQQESNEQTKEKNPTDNDKADTEVKRNAEAESARKDVKPEKTEVTYSLRVEGINETIYRNENLSMESSEEKIVAIDAIEQALKDAGIDYEIRDHSYIYSIAGEHAAYFNPMGMDGWQYLINDDYPSVYADQYELKDGDEIVIYYGNVGDIYTDEFSKGLADKVELLTLRPTVEVPKTLQAGESFEVTVTSTYDIYSPSYEFKDQGVETAIKEATIHFNDKTYETDKNGIAHIPAEDVKAGEYELKVTKDVAGSFPRLLRHYQKVIVKEKSNTSDDEDDEGNGAQEEEENDEQKEDNPSPNVIDRDLTEAIEAATNQILSSPSGVQSEWQALTLARLGKEIPASYRHSFKEKVEKQIKGPLKEEGRLQITDVARLALGAKAIGKDPQDLYGINLMELIYNSPDNSRGVDIMTNKGVNGPVYALLALDSFDYQVPKDARWTREKIVNHLLSLQNEDGSWPLFGDTPNVDLTGTAIAALSNYQQDTKVQEAVDHAVSFLINAQDEKGGYDDPWSGGITSGTISQVIVGLAAAGVDPTNEDFTKADGHLIDILQSFQTKDGGFKHVKSNENSNGMATEQALQALVAYKLFLEGEGSLFQFETVEQDNGEETGNGKGTTDANEKVEDDSGDSIDENNNNKVNQHAKDKAHGDGSKSENNGKTAEVESLTDSQTIEKVTSDDSVRDKDEAAGKLPSTATNIFAYIVVGLTLVLLGSIVFVMRNRQMRTNK